MKFPAHKDVEEGTEGQACECGTCGKDVFAIRDPADRLRQKLDISSARLKRLTSWSNHE